MTQLSPSDIQYQLDHLHDSRVHELLVAQIICFVLAVTAVILRLASRRLSKVPVQFDDYMTLMALVLLTAFLTVGMLAIHNGAARHVILVKDPILYIKLVFAISLLYLVGIAAVKFSILLLYHRIFGVSKNLRNVSWSLAVFILAYTIAGMFVVIFQCQPVHGFWDTTIKATCIDFSAPAIILASFNVVTDILTLALPMPLIWSLRMSRGRKLQITGIFLLGGLVCIGSIYRTTIVHRMSQPDATWSDVDPAIWAMVEMSMGIVSGCLPTLRPVVHWITHGGTYEKRPSVDHLQRSNDHQKKRGAFSWLLPSSLQLSDAKTDELTLKESTEEDHGV